LKKHGVQQSIIAATLSSNNQNPLDSITTLIGQVVFVPAAMIVNFAVAYFGVHVLMDAL
jgi:hypothetical protein